MDRRTFLAASAFSLAGSVVGSAAEESRLRVGVIGHTGRGNYGHGLDTVWLKVPETEIVAVADAHPAGLEQAGKRLGVEQQFADYHDMLKAARCDLVAICPRQPDQHCEMVLAAVEAGARGIYLEKPFCRTPAEADQIIAACQRRNVKLAVAHRNRYHPTLQAIDAMISAGKLGRVLEIRGRGKGDARGGGEDLWVLGSHVLNLICYFGGTPRTCSAVLLQEGRRVTEADVRPGNEALGPLAGNEVHARYLMSRGMTAYFDSIANDGTRSQGFGLRIIGSEGVVDIKADRQPLAHWIEGNPLEPTSQGRPWIEISSAGPGEPEPHDDLAEKIGQHVGVVEDLLAAIRDDREPLCGMHDGAMTVEMICGVFESHLQQSRVVEIPLKEREHPLAKLSS